MFIGPSLDSRSVVNDSQRRLLSEPSGERRLPLVYLVDSILKNIGGPYFPAFYGILVEVIGSTYALLPEVPSRTAAA